MSKIQIFIMIEYDASKEGEVGSLYCTINRLGFDFKSMPSKKTGFGRVLIKSKALDHKDDSFKKFFELVDEIKMNHNNIEILKTSTL
jgi:hypothetical protein